jgi:hypothetical protein
VGTLCVRARGELAAELVSFEKPKLQLEGERVAVLFFDDVRKSLVVAMLSDETAREPVGVGSLSREGVGVKELLELEEGEGESFLKGKGRRDNDLGFDQCRPGVIEWCTSIC